MNGTSAEILAAIRKKYPRTAVVPELTIDVPEYYEDRVGLKEYRRIDALMFDGLQRTAIEVKVSAADWKRESMAKYGPWTRVSHRFIYAVPAGLVAPASAYRGAGIWWVHPDGRIEVKRKARINNHPEPLPNMVIQRLAYRAAGVPLPKEEP